MNYYYADTNNESVGPIDIEYLHSLYRQGMITVDTPVIIEGNESWETYGAMFSSGEFLGRPFQQTIKEIRDQSSESLPPLPKSKRILISTLIIAVVLVGVLLTASHFAQKYEARKKENIARIEAIKKAETAKAEAERIEVMRLQAEVAAKAEAEITQAKRLEAEHLQKAKEKDAAETAETNAVKERLRVEGTVSQFSDPENKAQFVHKSKMNQLEKALEAAKELDEAYLQSTQNPVNSNSALENIKRARINAAAAGVAGRSVTRIKGDIEIEDTWFEVSLQKAKLINAEAEARLAAVNRKLNVEKMIAQLASERAGHGKQSMTEAGIKDWAADEEIKAETNALVRARAKEEVEKKLLELELRDTKEKVESNPGKK